MQGGELISQVVTKLWNWSSLLQQERQRSEFRRLHSSVLMYYCTYYIFMQALCRSATDVVFEIVILITDISSWQNQAGMSTRR